MASRMECHIRSKKMQNTVETGEVNPQNQVVMARTML